MEREQQHAVSDLIAYADYSLELLPRLRPESGRAVGNAYPPPAGVPKLSHSRPIIPEIRGILLFWLIIKLMSVSNGSCRRMRIPGENSQAFFSVSSAESVSMYAE